MRDNLQIKEKAMARTKSTDHNLPDIHDEGKIKRYGLSIAIAALVILGLLFLVWTIFSAK